LVLALLEVADLLEGRGDTLLPFLAGLVGIGEPPADGEALLVIGEGARFVARAKLGRGEVLKADRRLSLLASIAVRIS
jgi:hypothetical protein